MIDLYRSCLHPLANAGRQGGRGMGSRRSWAAPTGLVRHEAVAWGAPTGWSQHEAVAWGGGIGDPTLTEKK